MGSDSLKENSNKNDAVAGDRTRVRPRDRREYSPLYYNDIAGYHIRDTPIYLIIDAEQVP